MTATFDPALGNSISKVRFHVGDTDVNNAMLQDETITALLVSQGTIEKAVIAILLHLISEMSRPNFRADWLQVDHDSALKGLRDLLAEKRAEFGIPALTAFLKTVERVD
jgi:hypothetical protein